MREKACRRDNDRLLEKSYIISSGVYSFIEGGTRVNPGFLKGATKSSIHSSYPTLADGDKRGGTWPIYNVPAPIYIGHCTRMHGWKGIVCDVRYTHRIGKTDWPLADFCVLILVF